jgi:hypothetical protein
LDARSTDHNRFDLRLASIFRSFLGNRIHRMGASSGLTSFDLGTPLRTERRRDCCCPRAPDLAMSGYNRYSLSDACALAQCCPVKPVRERASTGPARFDAVPITAAMAEALRRVWCREKSLYPQELESWWMSATLALSEPE